MAVPSGSPSKTKSVSRTKESKKRPQAQTDDTNGGGQGQPKRTKSPGVRVVGGRIYDSENGKTCHQCRQKTMDFAASCKNEKAGKRCSLCVCHKCLLNRYGEKAEEVDLVSDWSCPKCRGICNCSQCMKKKGHKPTGILIHTAKATGFKSASELIQVKGIENLEIFKSVERAVASPKKPVASPKKPIASNGESKVVSPRKIGKENSIDTSNEANLNPSKSKPVSAEKKTKKAKREGLKEISNATKDDNACSEKNSPKRPKIPEKVFEKEIKTKGIGAPLEKKKSKQIVVDEVALIPTLLDDEKMKNDSGKFQDEVVKKASKDDKKQAKIKDSLKTQGFKKCATNLEQTEAEINIPLPKATILTTVWGIDLSPEDVGHALQFLEFCAAFGKVLDMKKTQGQSVLRELIRGSSGRRGQYSSAVRFHIQLLSLIQEEMGEKSPSFSKKKSWLQALEKYISESECVPKELSSSALGGDVDEYDGLDFSKKLRLLNFLCDEALRTEKLRNWIEDENSKVVEKEKESKEKVNAAKSKEKLLKKKLQDDIAKAIIAKNGAPLTIAEHEDIVFQIKSDVAEAHAEILRAKGCLAKRKHWADAVRTEPNFFDAEGHVFWKLRCCGGEGDMLLQDMGTADLDAVAEKWFIYGSERKGEIEKYISSIRAKRARIQNFAPVLICGSYLEDL